MWHCNYCIFLPPYIWDPRILFIYLFEPLTYLKVSMSPQIKCFPNRFYASDLPPSLDTFCLFNDLNVRAGQRTLNNLCKAPSQMWHLLNLSSVMPSMCISERSQGKPPSKPTYKGEWSKRKAFVLLRVKSLNVQNEGLKDKLVAFDFYLNVRM